MASRTDDGAIPARVGPPTTAMTAATRPWRRLRVGVGKAAAYGLLVLLALTMLAPLIWMVATSLKTYTELFATPPRLLPETPVWANYVQAWRTAPFGSFFANSIEVAVAVTLGEVLTSSLAGYVFARMRFPGRDKLFLVYLATLMVPSQVTLVPLYVLVRSFGWVNSYAGLIVPFLASAYGTFLMRQYMLTIPRDLDEAARIDGANHLVIYARIILPLSGPALATLGALVFLTNWNSFLWPLIITSRESMRTLPIGLALLRTPDSIALTQWQLLMAISTLAMVPTLVVFLIAQRYLVQGIAMSGLKG